MKREQNVLEITGEKQRTGLIIINPGHDRDDSVLNCPHKIFNSAIEYITQQHAEA